MTEPYFSNEVLEAFSYGDSKRIVVLCEHASAQLPEGIAWGDARALHDTHWAFDRGARELAQEIANALCTQLVLSKISRLWVDLNREENADDLIRQEAEGQVIPWNNDVSLEEREKRLEGVYRPFHQWIESLTEKLSIELVLSIHSFTPVWEGESRDVEVGILFDENDDLAMDVAVSLSDREQATWLNEPYSGKGGLMYSASRHARARKCQALELEVRQDLAEDSAWRAVFVPKFVASLLDALDGRVE